MSRRISPHSLWPAAHDRKRNLDRLRFATRTTAPATRRTAAGWSLLSRALCRAASMARSEQSSALASGRSSGPAPTGVMSASTAAPRTTAHRASITVATRPAQPTTQTRCLGALTTASSQATSAAGPTRASEASSQGLMGWKGQICRFPRAARARGRSSMRVRPGRTRVSSGTPRTTAPLATTPAVATARTAIST